MASAVKVDVVLRMPFWSSSAIDVGVEATLSTRRLNLSSSLRGSWSFAPKLSRISHSAAHLLLPFQRSSFHTLFEVLSWHFQMAATTGGMSHLSSLVSTG